MTLTDFRLANVLELSDGSTVEWESVGQGPPLMWVEGGPGFWAHLARPDVALVADRFTCYLVNAPGCGRTSAPADFDGYSVASMLDFFERVRNRLGLGRVTVMGHSWGGFLAAAWAAMRGDEIDRLIVIDGYPGGGESNGVDVAAADAERERCFTHHSAAPWFADAKAALDSDEEADVAKETPDDEQEWISSFHPVWPLYFYDPMSANAFAHLHRIRSEVRMNMDMELAWFGGTTAFDDVSILEPLHGVQCPVLVVAGSHDFICGPAWNRPIADAVPGARYVEISETGHFPHYERPEEFRSVLSAFLDDRHREK